MLGTAEPVDWAGDPFEIEGRFKPGRGHRDFDDYLFHFETYRNVEGDIPLNLAATAMAFYAYAATADPKYKEWIQEYSDAWVERTHANDGLIPGNVGLDGKVGSGLAGGDWWRGVYGWGHTGGFYGLDEHGKPIPHHRPNFQHRTPYAFGNALLVSGDRKYVDVWRTVMESVNKHSKVEDGVTLYPRMYNEDGWYDFQPEPFDPGALAVYLWSQDRERDHALVAADPWVRFLDGKDDDYPVEKLQADLEQVRQKVEKREQDTRSADMLLSEDPNGINPAEVWGLVQLMLGGLPTRHVGVPWHVAVRYFDAERRRAGIPPGVASLVDHISADEVGVQLVNLDPVHAKNLVLQSGAFAEHTIDSVAIDGERTDVGAQRGPRAPGARRRRAPAAERPALRQSADRRLPLAHVSLLIVPCIRPTRSVIHPASPTPFAEPTRPIHPRLKPINHSTGTPRSKPRPHPLKALLTSRSAMPAVTDRSRKTILGARDPHVSDSFKGTADTWPLPCSARTPTRWI